MAEKVFQLEAGLGLNSSAYESSLRRAEGQARSAASRISSALGSIRIPGLGNILAGAGIAGAGAGFLKAADNFEILQKRIAVSARNIGANAGAMSEALFTIAQGAAAPLENVVDLFQQMGQAQRSLGANKDQMLSVVQTVMQLGKVSGITNAQMTQGTRQLTQSLMTGRVLMEDWRRVLTDMPALGNRLANAIAGGVGPMREMVTSGKVTSKGLFDALLKMGPGVGKEFASGGFGNQLQDRLTVLSNSFARTAAAMEQASGVIAKLGKLLDFLGDHMTTLITIAAGLAGAFVFTKSVQGIKALTEAWKSFAEFSAGTSILKHLKGMLSEAHEINASLGGDVTAIGRIAALSEAITAIKVKPGAVVRRVGPDPMWAQAAKQTTRISSPSVMTAIPEVLGLAEPGRMAMRGFPRAPLAWKAPNLNPAPASGLLAKVTAISNIDVWRWFKNTRWGGAIIGMLSRIGGLVSGVAAGAIRAGSALLTMAIPLAAIGGIVAGTIALFQSLWNYIVSGGKDASNYLQKWVDSTFPALGDAIDWLMDKVAALWEMIKHPVDAIFGAKGPVLGERSTEALKKGRISVAPDLPEAYTLNQNKSRRAQGLPTVEAEAAQAKASGAISFSAGMGTDPAVASAMLDEMKRQTALQQRIADLFRGDANARAAAY